jgi:hypothetical protein
MIRMSPCTRRAYLTARLEVTMKYGLCTLLVLAGAIAVPTAAQQATDADCSATATQATGYTPGASTGPDGGRIRGAAKGAAAGAAVGAVQGNQYDNASGALKDANQQNKA